MISDDIIVASVNLTADVYRTLGIGTVNGVYDTGYACANTHGKINILSRYKPVRHSGIFASVPGSASYNPNWWRAADGNCGLVLKSLGSKYKDVVNWCNGNLNGWAYQAPDGSWPKRITDFCGYNPNAEPFIYSYEVSQSVVPVGTPVMVVAASPDIADADYKYTDLTKPPLSTELRIGDIETVKNAYFGVYMTYQGQYRRVTSNIPVSETNGMLEIEIPTAGMSVGLWKVYPFLSSVKLGINDSDSVAGTFWTVPYATPLSVQLIASALYMYVTFDKPFTGSGGNYTVNIIIDNQTGTAVRCNTNLWRVRFSDKDMDDDEVVGETLGTIPDFSVPANSEITVQATIQVSAAVAAAGAPMLLISLGGGTYRLYHQFDDERGEEGPRI
ncbi:MAG: hypothetical protein NC212_10965 [Staphylococcus sp.]|nr:hypothetical protein [Staphylococcus sp.]